MPNVLSVLSMKSKGGGSSGIVADGFSAEEPYSKGEYVIQGGTLYVFTADHAAGAWTGTDADEVTVGEELTDVKSAISANGGKGAYTYGGKDLSTVFADEDALHDAIAAEDFSKINIGDYWPISLSGTYRDYGTLTCQQGQKYFSDTALTTEVGEADKDYDATAVSNANVLGSAEAWCEVTIGGTKRYCAFADCLPYRERVLTNAIMLLEVAAINPYWRYGDSGPTSSATPHVVFLSRDCLPQSLRFRKANEYWEGQHFDEFTGDGTTAEYTLSGTVGTIGYVWVAGAKKAYNTDYTYASNKITFKSGKIPANGAAIVVEWMDALCPWTGGALYRTLNDPDYGVLKLIQTSYPKLYSHMQNMRYNAETRNKTNQQGGAWTNRGMLFLPTNDEIWSRYEYASTTTYTVGQLQWPIFAGSRKHLSKGIGNGQSGSYWWSASSNNVAYIAFVNSAGAPNGTNASTSLGAALGFLLT